MEITEHELEAAADLVHDTIALDRAFSAGPLTVDAGELAERLGLREKTVRLVLEAYADEPEIPVTENGDKWEVAA